MLYIFLKAMLIGLAIAAPVGPIGVLCITRSLNKGFFSGFLTGLGAASADAIFTCVAVFGLSAITSLLIHNQWIIKIVGGCLILMIRAPCINTIVIACPALPIQIIRQTYFLSFCTEFLKA